MALTPAPTAISIKITTITTNKVKGFSCPTHPLQYGTDHLLWLLPFASILEVASCGRQQHTHKVGQINLPSGESTVTAMRLIGIDGWTGIGTETTDDRGNHDVIPAVHTKSDPYNLPSATNCSSWPWL
jgi:hypothetical protein